MNLTLLFIVEANIFFVKLNQGQVHYHPCLKNIREFDKKGVSLLGCFPYPAGSLLINQLDGTEWRLKTVNQQSLDIEFGNSRIGLVKKFKIKILVKIIGQTNNMDPGSLILRIRIEV